MLAVEGVGGLGGAGAGTPLPPGKSWRVNCDGVLCCNAQVSIALTDRCGLMAQLHAVHVLRISAPSRRFLRVAHTA
jgi:hypothetical protein